MLVGEINYMYLLVYILEVFFFFLIDYLLLNNYVNFIIIYKFDFFDEEVRFLEVNI